MLDHHDRGVGYVDADLDDGRCHQQPRLAILEGQHGRILFRAAHAAVDEPDRRTNRLFENGEAFLGRHQVRDVRFLDQRADPIGLLAVGDGRAQPLDDLAGAFARNRHRLDRLSSGRLLCQFRHVHVAEGGKHERARDRGGGHHQHMRRDPLGSQAQALVHPEPVLLVDDRQHQVAVVDRILEQRMRADDDLRLSGGNPRGDHLAFLALGASRQDLDGYSGGRGKAGNRRMVLARQDLGRRHQHRLSAAFHHGGHGKQRHQRLPGADIALQQPQHAGIGRHVGEDIGDCLGLAAGRGKGQGREDLARDRARRLDRRAGHLAQLLAHQRQ